MNTVPVAGFEKFYVVDESGCIRSLKNGVALKPISFNGGYQKVTLCGGGIKKQMLVHRIVLTSFRGPPPQGHESRHLNSIRSDNRLANLEWSTHYDNILDRESLGTNPRGERNGFSKLTAAAANEIVAKYKAGGVTQKFLAREYGVSQAAVSLLTAGKTWQDLPR